MAQPLTDRQAARLAPLGLLADEPDALAAAWNRVEQMWTETIARASRAAPSLLTRGVNDEWSFVETLRHLLFVTDSWVGRVVLDLPTPYDPLGLPPHFLTDVADLGLDLAASPVLDEVLASRARRVALARDTIASTDSHELDRVCTQLGGQFTVLGALQVVIFEEWAHHVFATRDLDVLGV